MKVMHELLEELGRHHLYANTPIKVLQRSKKGWVARTIESVSVESDNGVKTVLVKIDAD